MSQTPAGPMPHPLGLIPASAADPVGASLPRWDFAFPADLAAVLAAMGLPTSGVTGFRLTMKGTDPARITVRSVVRPSQPDGEWLESTQRYQLRFVSEADRRALAQAIAAAAGLPFDDNPVHGVAIHAMGGVGAVSFKAWRYAQKGEVAQVADAVKRGGFVLCLDDRMRVSPLRERVFPLMGGSISPSPDRDR